MLKLQERERERECRTKITKQKQNNKRGKYQKHTRTNTKQDSWRKQVRCELMDAKGEWMLPRGSIRDEGLSPQNGLLLPRGVLRTVCLIPALRTHSEVPEHRPRDVLFYHQWMRTQITMRARERAEHKGTACGYPLENVRCALQASSRARIQGSLKYMLNI